MAKFEAVYEILKTF